MFVEQLQVSCEAVKPQISLSDVEKCTCWSELVDLLVPAHPAVLREKPSAAQCVSLMVAVLLSHKCGDER